MILDSSAIVAILLEEQEIGSLLTKMNRASYLAVSGPILVESALVLTGRLKTDATDVLSEFLQEFEVSLVPFGDAQWREAASAFKRFGKGRHPAGLNLGDCIAYATAKIAGLPLLFIGNDFPKTDLDLA
jgi:ribonuclease VapC